MKRLALVALVLLFATRAGAESVHVAVATNFATTCNAIGAAFTAATQHDVVISEGSSGKLAAQIANGAPFEVFLSADALRPAKLEAEQKTVAGTRFVYAVGKLALWSARPDFVKGEATLRGDAFRHLAIANPELAPYGAAARDVLQHLQLWDALQPKLVRGEDIGQAFHFVSTGNAELGFVALSQIAANDDGSRWLVPQDLYAPIEQQAVLLLPGRDDPAARAFLEFLKGDAARALIEAAGYGAPATP
jgi:molybdate transport system substrate-binding protein